RVAARFADSWNAPLLTPGEVAERAEKLKGFCDAIGRSMPEISYYGPVWVDEDEERMARRLERAHASENRNVRLYARVAISGTAEQAIMRIREYEEAGVTHFVCHFGRADVTSGTEAFAKTILPAFR
ncbi:MAG: hypothetical protein ACRDKG_02610, partial [Actinomycetota bacterium]